MDQHATCADLMSAAERELAAFLCAVEESYGPEHAVVSAEDWLAELESLECSSEAKDEEWRRVTIAVGARLAVRLGSYMQTEDAGLNSASSTRRYRRA